MKTENTLEKQHKDLMIDSSDEMHGDQLFGHPIMEEIRRIKKGETQHISKPSKRNIRGLFKNIYIK